MSIKVLAYFWISIYSIQLQLNYNIVCVCFQDVKEKNKV